MSTAPATMAQCADINILLSGYVDAELTQQEAQKVRIHIENCAHCRRLHADLLTLKNQMQQLPYSPTDEDRLNAIETDYLARGSSWLGWSLLVCGMLIGGGIALFGFFSSPEVPGLVRFFYALLMFGGLALFLSVLRQRLRVYKIDKYRKVKL